MEMPTFSIITPSYNQGRFLEETIRSVLCQRGDFFIEYFVMDGGSTDDSIEIIDRYDRLLKDEKWPVECLGIIFNWVSRKDKGQVDALEQGFACARGNIGSWLNSDDAFYSPAVLQTVAKYFKSNDVDLVIGDGLFIDKDGQEIGLHHTDRIDLKELIFLDYHILQPASFLKMDFFRSNSFDKNLDYTFDADFFIRLILSGIRFKKVPDTLACFRIYPEIKTISGMGKRLKESMLIEKKISDNKLLLFISWIYKYVDIVVKAKYGKTRLFKMTFPVFRSFFYLIIMGTWGRK